MADKITVWIDYVLNWYVSVPLSGDERIDAATARNALSAAYRDEYGHDGPTFDVVRAHVTNHGTATYLRCPKI